MSSRSTFRARVTGAADPGLRRPDQLYRAQAVIKRDIDNLKAAASGAKVEELFMTAVAPASTAYDGVDEYYQDEQDYIFAIADALREEYRAVHKAGFVLQVDDAVARPTCTIISCSNSPAKYREWAELCVAALNHALEGIPEDRVRYHICFGSWHVPHVADAPLEAIVDIVLKVKARRIRSRPPIRGTSMNGGCGKR